MVLASKHFLALSATAIDVSSNETWSQRQLKVCIICGLSRDLWAGPLKFAFLVTVFLKAVRKIKEPSDELK